MKPCSQCATDTETVADETGGWFCRCSKCGRSGDTAYTKPGAAKKWLELLLWRKKLGGIEDH